MERILPDPDPESLVAEAVLAARRGDWSLVRELRERHPRYATLIGTRIARLGRLGFVPVDTASPERIGPYRIRKRLGTGGMGIVYLGEQETPVRRRVAVKVIRARAASDAIVERFDLERQTLARLQHPHIATLFDAGQTEDGDPFFAMEFIEGRDLARYCDESRLSVARRLELMAQVCEAVEYAHRKGVVHRDLKPGNILVRDPVGGAAASPAVIDFGIAKVLEAGETSTQTAEFSILGTPSYMSPEQARGDRRKTDTRTDVYSLGVILYELVTGELPHDPLELAQAAPGDLGVLLSRPPTPPRAHAGGEDAATARGTTAAGLRRAVRGDLNWVLLRALEVEPDRRYGGAGELAAELHRILKRQPVLAGPPGALYRFGRFVSRNRAASGAVAALLVGLSLATWISLRFALSERDQRRRAEESGVAAVKAADAALAAGRAEQRMRAEAEARARELAAVTAMQGEMLATLSPDVMGTDLREDLREESLAAWSRARLDEGEITARDEELQRLLEGVNFTNAAVQSIDRHVLARALATIDERFHDQPLVRAALLQTIASTYRNLGLYDAALGPQEDAVRIRRERLGDDDTATLTSRAELALLRDDRGERDPAAQIYRDVLARRERLLGRDDPEALIAMNNLALALEEGGAYGEAEALMGEVLERAERTLGPDHAQTLNAHANLALVLENLGRREEAESHLRTALEGRRAVLGDAHPATLTALANLGEFLRVGGRIEEAEECQREAAEGRRRVLGDAHADTLNSLANLAAIFTAQGRLAESEPLLEEAVATCQQTLGPLHPRTIRALSDLAGVYMNQGRYGEAESIEGQVLERYRKEYGDDHLHTITSIGNLGALLRAMGRLGEAEERFREAMDRARAALGEEHHLSILSMYNLATVIRLGGRSEEAEELLRRAIELSRAELGEDHPYALAAGHALGKLLVEAGRLDEAEPVVAGLVEVHRRTYGATNRRTDQVRLLQVQLRTEQGRLEEAEATCIELLARARESLGEGHPDALMISVQLGVIEGRAGRPEEALAMLGEAQSTCERAFGREHPISLQAYRERLALLAAAGDLGRAAPIAAAAATAALDQSGDLGRKTFLQALACLRAHVTGDGPSSSETVAELEARGRALGWVEADPESAATPPVGTTSGDGR